MNGGPPRDGIPSIDSPKFISAAKVDWLLPGSRVLGLEINGVIRADPLVILNWHEIVNDSVGGVPLAVNYSPLCGTGMAFRRDFSGTITTLDVSGLLYNNDLMLYDRESESLWSQVMCQDFSDPRKDERLITVPKENTTWADWKNQHPQTEVLSKDTGFIREYGRASYGNYDENGYISTPVILQ